MKEPTRPSAPPTVAYERTVLLKYIGNLLESGDSLFRQDTVESIAEATQLYLEAEKLLGPKPKSAPPDEEMLRYRDAVTDRLLKIRNSQTIGGVKRVLPTFAPPIDPGLVVRAAPTRDEKR